MVSTFVYFAPFLLTHMGNPNNQLSDEQLASMLNTWAKWDRVRQIVGLIPLVIFLYCYGNIKLARAKKGKDVVAIGSLARA